MVGGVGMIDDVMCVMIGVVEFVKLLIRVWQNFLEKFGGIVVILGIFVDEIFVDEI